MSKLTLLLLSALITGQAYAETFEWRPQLRGHGLPPLVTGPLPSSDRPFDRSKGVQYPASTVCFENLREPELAVCEEREATEWIGLRISRAGDTCRVVEQSRVPTEPERIVFSTVTTVLPCADIEPGQ